MYKKIIAFFLFVTLLFSNTGFVYAENEETNINEYYGDDVVSSSSVSLLNNESENSQIVQNVVLVLDKSGSMRGDNLTTLKTAAKNFCESILEANSNNRIGIVTFSSSSSYKVYDFSSSLDELNNNIDSISASGGTYLSRALSETNRMFAELTYGDSSVNYINSVVIMSDGEVSDETEVTTIFNEMTNYYNIYSVYLGNSSSAKSFMESIQNSGFYYAENLNELIENFGKILNQILNPLNVMLSHSCTYDFVVKEYEITATIDNPNTNAVSNVKVTLNLPDVFELDESVNPQTVTFDKISDTETSVTWKVSVAQEEKDCYYEISVDVSADELTAMTISDQISVNGWHSDSKVLDITSDTWSFENYSSDSYNIDSDVLNGLLISLSNSDKQNIKNIASGSAKGHCYGMSTTVVLAKSGELKASEIKSDVSNIHEISKENADQTISYYQLTQFLPSIDEKMNELSYNNISIKESLEQIANKARLVSNGANPTVIGFYLDNGGGHAVVCYNYAMLSDDQYVTFQGVDYNTCIFIYDCNYPDSEAVVFCDSYFDEDTQKVVMNNDNYVYLADKTGNGNWIEPYSISHFGGVSNDIDLLNTKDIQTMDKNYSSWLRVNTALIYSNGLNIKYGTNENIIGINGLQNSNNIKEHFDMCESTATEKYYNIYMDEIEPLELYYDDETGDIDCSIVYDDFYCVANADSAGKAVLEPDGLARLEAVNSEYELALTANDEYMVTPWYTVNVSGTAEAENPSLEICDEGYIFEGESLNNITVSANNDDETKVLTFDSDETSVLITDKDDELVIMEDSNDDGTYDTVIASTDELQEKTTSKYSGSTGAGASSLKVTNYSDTMATLEEATESTTEENTLLSSVRVSIGSKIVAVNGENYEMDVAPYIQASSNSTLVPLRFVALAIMGENVDDADTSSIIKWEADTKTAVITFGNDVIKFTAESSYMTINDKQVLMENGVKAEIKEGRMFIPFRALGKALGAEVEWDNETKTAYYNVK